MHAVFYHVAATASTLEGWRLFFAFFAAGVLFALICFLLAREAVQVGAYGFARSRAWWRRRSRRRVAEDERERRRRLELEAAVRVPPSFSAPAPKAFERRRA